MILASFSADYLKALMFESCRHIRITIPTMNINLDLKGK